MLSSIISARWKKHIAYVAMSVFATWHVAALVVAPAPKQSAIPKILQPLMEPYTNFLYLDISWAFFAPVGMTAEFHYSIEDTDGGTHTFSPLRGLRWYHPDKLWIIDRFRAVTEFPETFGDAVMTSLCRKHTPLKPTKITIFVIEQTKEFLPEHHQAARTSLDSEFATKRILGSKPCPKA